jgi:hypothetical protein
MSNQQEIISDYIEIVESIGNKIIKYNLDNNTRLGRKEWTTQIFESLTNTAYYKYKYWVHANPNNEDNTINEWLYDMVWYESEDKDGKIIKELKMILESEWEKDLYAHQYDFQKLVQSKCKLKIFMFRAVKVFERVKKLVKIIDTNDSIKETYLFVGWDDNIGFSYYQYFRNDLIEHNS